MASRMRQREQLRTAPVGSKRAVRAAVHDGASGGKPAPTTYSELIALQRAAGNAAVCQLLEDRATEPGSAGRLTLEAGGRELPVQRGFFDSIGNFFKGAAKAVGSAVSGVGRGIGEASSTVVSAGGCAARRVDARVVDSGEGRPKW